MMPQFQLAVNAENTCMVVLWDMQSFNMGSFELQESVHREIRVLISIYLIKFHLFFCLTFFVL